MSFVHVNSVMVRGAAIGPKLYRTTDGRIRFEFVVESRRENGSVHRIPILTEGQQALDCFMLFRAGRDVEVYGYLKQRRRGRVAVKAEPDGVTWRPSAPGEMTVNDLLEKVEAFRGVFPEREYGGIGEIEVSLAEEAGETFDTRIGEGTNAFQEPGAFTGGNPGAAFDPETGWPLSRSG